MWMIADVERVFGKNIKPSEIKKYWGCTDMQLVEHLNEKSNFHFMLEDFVNFGRYVFTVDFEGCTEKQKLKMFNYKNTELEILEANPYGDYEEPLFTECDAEDNICSITPFYDNKVIFEDQFNDTDFSDDDSVRNYSSDED